MEMFQKQMALRLCIKNFNNHQALKILNLYLTKYIGLISIYYKLYEIIFFPPPSLLFSLYLENVKRKKKITKC